MKMYKIMKFGTYEIVSHEFANSKLEAANAFCGKPSPYFVPKETILGTVVVGITDNINYIVKECECENCKELKLVGDEFVCERKLECTSWIDFVAKVYNEMET